MTSFALRRSMMSAPAAAAAGVPSAASMSRFFCTGYCSRGPLRWRLYSQRLTARWRALPRPKMSSVTARWSRRKKAIVFYTTIAGAAAISEAALRLPDKVGPIYKYDYLGILRRLRQLRTTTSKCIMSFKVRRRGRLAPGI